MGKVVEFLKKLSGKVKLIIILAVLFILALIFGSAYDRPELKTSLQLDWIKVKNFLGFNKTHNNLSAEPPAINIPILGYPKPKGESPAAGASKPGQIASGITTTKNPPDNSRSIPGKAPADKTKPPAEIAVHVATEILPYRGQSLADLENNLYFSREVKSVQRKVISGKEVIYYTTSRRPWNYNAVFIAGDKIYYQLSDKPISQLRY